MKFRHQVKYNGVYYPAGADVPVGETIVEDKNAEETISQYVNEPNVEYTKADINKMNTAELRTLALDNGVENAKELYAAELKKVLINKFGL